MQPPKTSDKALELIRGMKSYYSKAFEQFEDDLAYYDGAIDELIPTPEGFDTTIPTTGRAVIDEAIDNIIPENIRVDYRPRGKKPGPKAEERADRVRQFCKSLYFHWRQNGSDFDFLRSLARSHFINGKACLKIIEDPSLWPSLSEEVEKELEATGGKEAVKERVQKIKEMRERSFPYLPRVLPAQTFMDSPTAVGRHLWMIEAYECDITEVRGLYEQFAPEKLGDQFQVRLNYHIYEVWTATHLDENGKLHQGKHWVFIDDEVLHEADNEYDDLPYYVRYSGHGREGLRGEQEMKAIGLYTPQVKSMIKAEARRHTQFDAIIQQYAYPIGVLPDTIGEADFDVSPGAMNHVPERIMEFTDRFFIKAPIPDSEYFNSMRVIENQIERGTTQVPLRGAPVPGTDSNAQLSTYLGQARLRLQSSEHSLRDAISWAFAFILRDIDRKQRTVSIRVGEMGNEMVTIGPDDIGGHYEAGITFLPNEESLRMQKLSVASDAMVKGGFSRYDAFEFAGFENPQELVQRRDADDLMQEPDIKRALAQKYLQEIGINADELAVQGQVSPQFVQMLAQAVLANMQQQMPQPPGMEQGGMGMQPPSQQDPTAALAQQGMDPMAQPPGAPVQDPGLASPGALQAGMQ